MSLSDKARKVLIAAVANKVVGKELADAIDAGVLSIGATGATGAKGNTGATGPSTYAAGGTGAQWATSNPTTIKAALDRIAVAIAAGLTGPIA